MRKFITITFTLLIIIFVSVAAQKKELSQARSYIKSGKDLDKAEELMRNLLVDSTNRSNKRIWTTLYDAVKMQYDAGNEKLYLQQKYDTANIFKLTLNLHDIAVALDSVDVQPNHKGRVLPEYRKRHAEELDVMRPNLYYGGAYQLRRNDFRTAYTYFETYLHTAEEPLFSSFDYAHKDTMMSKAAYWATYTGYRLEDPQLTLRYAQLAMDDTLRQEYTLQYMAEAYHQQRNDSGYTTTLRRGFSQFPEFPYFFPRLIDYYTGKNRPDSTLAIAERALRTNPHHPLFLFAKSTSLLNLGRYAECIAVSDSLIALNDSLADPYFNAGTAYLNQVLDLEKRQNPRQNRVQIRRLYQQARPYIERYRLLAPDEKDKWAPALYRIYLNLNMGKQFEEIDKILKK